MIIKKIICIGATVVAVTLTAGYFYNSSNVAKDIEYQYHTVRSGETLWDIAGKYNKDDREDIRKIIYEINKDNGIKNGLLEVGQTLKVRKR